MPTIQATCRSCGDVDLTVADVGVRVCVDDDRSSYHFRCPHCRMIEAKPAEPHVVDWLVHAGVELSTWSLPAELFERHDGPSITHDDLLDFHRHLEDDESFIQLLSSIR